MSENKTYNHVNKDNDMDDWECNICHRNIKKTNNFPVYSKKFDIICRDCCLLGVLYKNGKLDDLKLMELPEKVREGIKTMFPDEAVVNEYDR